MRRHVWVCLCAVIILLASAPAWAEEVLSPDQVQGGETLAPEPVPGILAADGSATGTGTTFAVTGSRFLDVTVTFSAPVKAAVSSFPSEIDVKVEGAPGTAAARLTVAGLAPGATYYLSVDGVPPQPVTTDAAGSYALDLDLGAPRMVVLLANHSTIYLSPDLADHRVTGFDRPGVGTWDPFTRTATLAIDPSETLWVWGDNITLDCQGHVFDGVGDVGVRLFGSNIVLRNAVIRNNSTGVAVNGPGCRITGCTLNGNFNGIGGRFPVQIDGNTIDGTLPDPAAVTWLAGFSGIELLEGNGSVIFNNLISRHLGMGIKLTRSNTCTIYKNDIANNGFGLYLAATSSGLFYNNNFIDNDFPGIGSKFQIHDHVYIDRYSGGTFSLDLPVGGNYFTAHNGGVLYGGTSGVDADGDGFFDSPYIMVRESGYPYTIFRDYHPYAAPINWRGNRPPVLAPIGNLTVPEGQPLLFTVSATDPDGDLLTYSAANLPPGASFDPATRTFSWTPGFDQAGNFAGIEFAVADDGTPMEVDVEVVTITVGNVNRAPVVGPVAPRSVSEYQTVAFSVTASDPDGDEVFLSTSALPAGAAFDPVTGAFTWTPTGGQVGDHLISFVATDAGVPPASSQVDVAISVGVLPPTDLNTLLIQQILALNLPTNVVNSYMAHLKKVNIFVQDGRVGAALNQLEAFIGRVQGDVAAGLVTPADGEFLINLAREIVAKLS